MKKFNLFNNDSYTEWRDIANLNINSSSNETNVISSIPSPLAYIYLCVRAFEYVNSSKIIQEDYYHKIVSDCLDIYEIQYYIDKGVLKNFEIIEWSIKSLDSKGLDSNNVRLLYEILKDSIGNLFSSLSFIRYQNKIIGSFSDEIISFKSPSINNVDILLPDGRFAFDNDEPLPLYKRNIKFQLYFQNRILNNEKNKHIRILVKYLRKNGLNINLNVEIGKQIKDKLQIKEYCLSLIASSNTSEVIEILLKYLENNKDKFEMIILISANYNSLIKNENNQTISYSDANVIAQRINYSLIQLINDII